MATTFVFLMICLVYGVVAHHPSSSYLPPSGGGRLATGGPTVSIPAQSPSVVTRPSVSYLAPSKRVGGRRPASHGYASPRPAVSAPILQRPVATAPINRPSIASAGIGATRPIQTGYHHGTHRIGTSRGSGYGPRTVGSHAPY